MKGDYSELLKIQILKLLKDDNIKEIEAVILYKIRENMIKSYMIKHLLDLINRIWILVNN